MMPGVWRGGIGLAAAGACLMAPAGAAAQLRPELTGELGVETRGFFSDPLNAEQDRNGASVMFQPEAYWSWDAGDQSLTFEPFLRVDAADEARTHFDVRVLRWEKVWDAWELRAGIGRVFWGVAESQHLIDIVNQTDLVENVDGEDKLGQPMVNLASVREWGTLEFFLLPGFRERTFPGAEGRLRFAPLVDTDNPEFESGAGAGRVDWAIRWSRTLGDFDVGIAHFEGTSRDPRLVPRDSPGGTVLTPFYDVISQTSMDAQYTRGGWLLKFEGLSRTGGPADRHFAMTGGFEYTFPQVLGSNADLGVIGEYLADDRGDRATTPFEDDVFVGARLALNDVQSTELLAGAIVDRESGATLFNVEASRRVGEAWSVDLQLRAFWGASAVDPLYGFRRDDYLGLTVSRWF